MAVYPTAALILMMITEEALASLMTVSISWWEMR